MTTSQHTDAAWQLGHELMQPMPEGWYRTEHELPTGHWEVKATAKGLYDNTGWPERMEKYAAMGFAMGRMVAHRLCREQAWAKHRKNTEGT